MAAGPLSSLAGRFDVEGSEAPMTVLDEIVAGVREDLAQREAATPLAAVKERAVRMTGAKDCVSRLRVSDAVTVIAEVKRSSPSRGSGWSA
jgi:indole-3-glycerol phosphate synthase